jgi:hypothetical protein
MGKRVVPKAWLAREGGNGIAIVGRGVSGAIGLPVRARIVTRRSTDSHEVRGESKDSSGNGSANSGHASSSVRAAHDVELHQWHSMSWSLLAQAPLRGSRLVSTLALEHDPGRDHARRDFGKTTRYCMGVWAHASGDEFELMHSADRTGRRM